MKLRHATLSLALLLAACGEPTESPVDAGQHTSDAGPEATPLYAIITQVPITGGGTQSYLVTSDDIEKEQTVGLEDALELEADSYIAAGLPRSGQIFVSSSKLPTVTRYTLDDDGELAKGETLSFQSKGVATTGGYQSQHYFVSETKAYYFDHVNYRLVIWNPKELSLVDSRDLTSSLKDGELTFRYSQSLAIGSGKHVILAGGWHAADVKRVPQKTALVIVDTETDAVTVKTDDRCGWARDGVLHTDGRIYFATESLGSGAHFVSPTTAGAPCIVRFDPAAGEFDSSWLVTLDEVVNPSTDGDIAGMLLPGAPGKGYIRVMDKAAAQAAWDVAVAGSKPFNGQHAAVGAWWHLWEIALGDVPTAARVERSDLVPMNGRTIPQNPGGMLVVPEFINNNAQSKFRIYGEQGIGDARTVVEGQVRGLLRIR